MGAVIYLEEVVPEMVRSKSRKLAVVRGSSKEPTDAEEHEGGEDAEDASDLFAGGDEHDRIRLEAARWSNEVIALLRMENISLREAWSRANEVFEEPVSHAPSAPIRRAHEREPLDLFSTSTSRATFARERIDPFAFMSAKSSGGTAKQPGPGAPKAAAPLPEPRRDPAAMTSSAEMVSAHVIPDPRKQRPAPGRSPGDQIQQGGAAAARRGDNPKIAGSNPAPATESPAPVSVIALVAKPEPVRGLVSFEMPTGESRRPTSGAADSDPGERNGAGTPRAGTPAAAPGGGLSASPPRPALSSTATKGNGTTDRAEFLAWLEARGAASRAEVRASGTLAPTSADSQLNKLRLQGRIEHGADGRWRLAPGGRVMPGRNGIVDRIRGLLSDGKARTVGAVAQEIHEDLLSVGSSMRQQRRLGRMRSNADGEFTLAGPTRADARADGGPIPSSRPRAKTLGGVIAKHTAMAGANDHGAPSIPPPPPSTAGDDPVATALLLKREKHVRAIAKIDEFLVSMSDL